MIEDYGGARAVMSPSGELLIALPIYADQSGVIMDSNTVESITGVAKISFGVYEQFGFLIYNPSIPYSFYVQSLDLFEDLGEL